MRSLRFAMVLCLPALPVPALAGGLIKKLPKDGAWVKFYMDHRQDGVVKWSNTGSFTIRSAGTETADGKQCRWIEFERVYGKSDTGLPPLTRLVKFLVPKDQLALRSNPLPNVVRVWYRYRVAMEEPIDPYKLTGPQPYGDNMILLPGAPKGSTAVSLKIAQVKKSRTFPYQDGEFKCKSAVRETYEFVEKPEGIPVTYRSSVTFTLWKHDRIPFAVAGGTIEFKRYDATGKMLIRKNTYDLSVSAFGTNAKSALPEQK